MAHGVFWMLLYGFLEGEDGFVLFALFAINLTKVELGFGEIRANAEGTGEFGFGVGQFAELEMEAAFLKIGDGMVGKKFGDAFPLVAGGGEIVFEFEKFGVVLAEIEIVG